jgi:hypothetical protein
MENTEKISITTKTLASGNCQVKFFVADEKKPQYGYLLVTEKRRMDTMNLNPFFPLSPTSEDHTFYLYSA